MNVLSKSDGIYMCVDMPGNIRNLYIVLSGLRFFVDSTFFPFIIQNDYKVSNKRIKTISINNRIPLKCCAIE